MSATTAWKYSGAAGALTALTPLFDATSGLLVAATGWKLMAFNPPADWTAVALADTVTGDRYMVVCEIATLSSSTTEPLLDRRLPGIEEAVRSSGLAAGATDAGLSRGLAGISGQTLVVNLADSRAAVRDGMATITMLAHHVIADISEF